MRIGVLSDTHLPEPTEAFAHFFERHLAGTDALVHCGDIVGPAMLAFLESHPAVYAVSGNMDSQLGGLPPTRRVDFGYGRSLGVVHGHGLSGESVPQAVVAAFVSGPRLLCFGHTHARYWAALGQGRFLLNPGSVTRPRDGRPGAALVQWPKGQDPVIQWIDAAD